MQAIKTDPVKTVLTITVGFLVVYVITKINAWLIAALVIGLIGIFSSYLAKKIDFLWMKLSYVLSLIVPNILLTLIFYLFLFPIALLSKITSRKDPLHLKNREDSIYCTVDKSFDAKSFSNPW